MKSFVSRFLQKVKRIDVFNKKVFSVLYSAAAVCIMIIGIAQAGLKNETTRSFFTKIDSYEGNYFEVTAEVSEEENHMITLFADGDDFDGAKILLNGADYADLVSGENEVEISKSSVIEIYSPKGKVNVKLKEMTDGLVMYTDLKEITAENQLKLFARVGIK